MLGDPCKSNRGDSRARAVVSRTCWVVSILLVDALLASAVIARAYSGDESAEPWREHVSANTQRKLIVGRASWYGQAVAGRKTATGERLDPNKLTAATMQLPLHSSVLVTNLKNGRSVPVRINDCGPYAKGRDIDVSKRAAEKLAMAHTGTIPVTIKLITTPPDVTYCARLKQRRRKVHGYVRPRRL